MKENEGDFLKAIVVGGGFSGLTIAYYLNQEGFEVEVFEKEAKLGGVLSSERHSFGLVERAANGIIETPLCRELISDLNLEVLRSKRKSRKKYIYRKFHLKSFPLNFFESCRFFFGLIGFLLFRSFLFQPQRFETGFHWGKRVFGKATTLWLIGPLFQGIYASNLRFLSATLLFQKFFNKQRKEKKNRSLFMKERKVKRTRGKASFQKLIAPRNGMEELINVLERTLKSRGTQFHLSSFFSFSRDHHESHHPLVIATGLKGAKNWILNNSSADLEKSYEKVKNLSLLSATLFYKSSSPFSGFGVLFPEEKIKALGVLNNGAIFDERLSGEGHSETWIFGGTKSPESLHESDKNILDIIQKERLKIFKDSNLPFHYKIWRSYDVFPCYSKELEEFLSFFNKEVLDRETSLKGEKNKIYFTGNYLGSLGLSGILSYNKTLSQKIMKDRIRIGCKE